MIGVHSFILQPTSILGVWWYNFYLDLIVFSKNNPSFLPIYEKLNVSDTKYDKIIKSISNADARQFATLLAAAKIGMTLRDSFKDYKKLLLIRNLFSSHLGDDDLPMVLADSPISSLQLIEIYLKHCQRFESLVYPKLHKLVQHGRYFDLTESLKHVKTNINILKNRSPNLHTSSLFTNKKPSREEIQLETKLAHELSKHIALQPTWTEISIDPPCGPILEAKFQELKHKIDTTALEEKQLQNDITDLQKEKETLEKKGKIKWTWNWVYSLFHLKPSELKQCLLHLEQKQSTLNRAHAKKVEYQKEYTFFTLFYSYSLALYKKSASTISQLPLLPIWNELDLESQAKTKRLVIDAYKAINWEFLVPKRMDEKEVPRIANTVALRVMTKVHLATYDKNFTACGALRSRKGIFIQGYGKIAPFFAKPEKTLNLGMLIDAAEEVANYSAMAKKG